MSDDDPMNFEKLANAIALDDQSTVEDLVFELTSVMLGSKKTPDEVVEFILHTLSNNNLYDKQISAYLLNYFEFEATKLTHVQKSRITKYLHAEGEKFTHVHSAQVVSELINNEYLKENSGG